VESWHTHTRGHRVRASRATIARSSSASHAPLDRAVSAPSSERTLTVSWASEREDAPMISCICERILRNCRSFCGSKSLTKLRAMDANWGMSSAYCAVTDACATHPPHEYIAQRAGGTVCRRRRRASLSAHTTRERGVDSVEVQCVQWPCD
jgi:hypothetical protein